MVQRVHDLFDAGVVVPPVNVKNVDVRGAELLERIFDAYVEGLEAVPAEVGLDGNGGVRTFVVRCVLRKIRSRNCTQS